MKYAFVISFYYEEMHGKINLKGYFSALNVWYGLSIAQLCRHD